MQEESQSEPLGFVSEREPTALSVPAPVQRSTNATASSTPRRFDAAPQRLMQESVQSFDEQPATRWEYGWVMLVVAMLTMLASSPGQTFGISVFNEAIRGELRLSRSQFAAAYTLGTIFSAFPVSFVGLCLDRFGLRRILLMAVFLFAGACLLLAQARSWPMLLLAFFCLRMLGPGTIALISGNILPYWFRRRLGTVEALRQLSVPASIALVSALNVWLLNSVGWRTAYTIWAAALTCGFLPIFLLTFRNRAVAPPAPSTSKASLPNTASHSPQSAIDQDFDCELTLPEALRTRVFWVITSGTCLYAMNITAMTFHLVSVFKDFGGSESQAAATTATLLSVSAIAMATSQLLGGVLADRIAPRGPMFCALLCMSCGFLLLNSPVGSDWAWMVGLLIGTSQGMYSSSTQPLWSRFFGLKHLGRIRGFVMSLMVAASSFGPYLAGLAREQSGSFSGMLVTFALLPLPIAFCALTVQAPASPSTQAT